MTYAKCSDFLTPSPTPPCLHFDATSLTKLPYCISFWGTPSPPPYADIISTCHLRPWMFIPSVESREVLQQLLVELESQVNDVRDNDIKLKTRSGKRYSVNFHWSKFSLADGKVIELCLGAMLI